MFTLSRLRNFGVMAHVDAGKTTLSERILFLSGRTHRIGEVHNGATQLDHLPQERDRGITITAAATTCSWKEHTLNLIDTPGHVDFTVEVRRSLRVLDGAVAVFDGVAGVEPQSEMVWRQADDHRVARICFVNKMDRPGANFAACIEEIRSRLGANALALQIPCFENGRIVGVVDLVEMQLTFWPDRDNITNEVVTTIPDTQLHEATVAREQLIEAIALEDAALMALFTSDGVSNDALRAAIRRCVIARSATVVLCGSALANVGMQPLLDAIVAYLPSPIDVESVVARSVSDSTNMVVCAPDVDGPLVALAFKVTHRRQGKATWIRVYSGTIETGARVLNASSGEIERVTKLTRLHADRGEDVAQALPGDIVAVVGLASATTGNTICTPMNPLVLDSLEFPEPVMAMSIEPVSNDDQDKLSVALHRLADEDPTFHVHVDSETGETIISGMGELHLEVLVDRLKTDHGVEVKTGHPKVAYRETITRAVRGHVYRHVKQSGGPGQFAHVVINLEPIDNQAPGELLFVDSTTGGAVPSAFASAAAVGATDALTNGPVARHPLVGCKLTLVDGSTHPKDSSEQAFRAAGAAALREAARLGSPVVLEPVMRVTVTTPESHLGGVLGSIGGRRGVVVALDDRRSDVSNAVDASHREKQVTAMVPLAELFGFTSELRSVSQGRAIAAMTLDRYQPIP
jgi:elongation factor G